MTIFESGHQRRNATGEYLIDSDPNHDLQNKDMDLGKLGNKWQIINVQWVKENWGIFYGFFCKQLK